KVVPCEPHAIRTRPASKPMCLDMPTASACASRCASAPGRIRGLVLQAYIGCGGATYNRRMATLAKTHRRVFLAWGLAIAALVVITIPFPPERRPGPLAATDWLVWLALYATFLVVFWRASRLTQGAARWVSLGC